MGEDPSRLAEPDDQFCVKCRARGGLNPGTMEGTPETNARRVGLVVDHIIGNRRLFWERSDGRPLCRDDHDIVKQREEHGRMTNGSDAKGQPLDPTHPWNAKD